MNETCTPPVRYRVQLARWAQVGAGSAMPPLHVTLPRFATWHGIWHFGPRVHASGSYGSLRIYLLFVPGRDSLRLMILFYLI